MKTKIIAAALMMISIPIGAQSSQPDCSLDYVGTDCLEIHLDPELTANLVASGFSSSIDVIQGDSGQFDLEVSLPANAVAPVTVTVQASSKSDDVEAQACDTGGDPRVMASKQQFDADLVGAKTRSSTEYTIYPQWFNAVFGEIQKFDTSLKISVVVTPAVSAEAPPQYFECTTEIKIIPTAAHQLLTDTLTVNGILRAIPPAAQTLILGKCGVTQSTFSGCETSVGLASDENLPLLLVGPTEELNLTAKVGRYFTVDGGTDYGFNEEYYVRDGFSPLNNCRPASPYQTHGDGITLTPTSQKFTLQSKDGAAEADQICYWAEIWSDDDFEDDKEDTKIIDVWVRYVNASDAIDQRYIAIDASCQPALNQYLSEYTIDHNLAADCNGLVDDWHLDIDKGFRVKNKYGKIAVVPASTIGESGYI